MANKTKLTDLPQEFEMLKHTFERFEEEDDRHSYQARGEYQVFDDEHDEAWTPELEKDASILETVLEKTLDVTVEYQEKGWISVTVTEKK